MYIFAPGMTTNNIVFWVQVDLGLVRVQVWFWFRFGSGSGLVQVQVWFGWVQVWCIGSTCNCVPIFSLQA